MADFKFEPMRSLIYVDCVSEDYRPKLQRWLYKTHIPDSISQFEPYVTKYAFYPSFPIPPQGDRFGYVRMQLTEHHWLVSDLDPRLEIKAIAETFPMDVLVWQGQIPAAAHTDAQIDTDGDAGNAARKSNNAEGNPFIFAFLPMWWEKDLKGKGRTIEDDYRINYHRDHIKEMENAIFEDGVDCLGYITWGPIDILASMCNMDKRYGFVYVNRTNKDLRDMKRIPKKSYQWIKKAFESNGEDLD